MDLTVVTIVLNHRMGLLETSHFLTVPGRRPSSSMEWLIVDGGSMDGSAELGQNFQAQGSASFIAGPDSGIFDAMNKGLALAKGAFILFLNAGDCLATEHTLDRILQAIKNRSPEVGFFYGDALERSEFREIRLKRARSPGAIWYGMFTHHQAMLYETNRAKATKFDLSYKVAGDYDFTSRFLVTRVATERLDFTVCSFEKGGISEMSAVIGRQENWRIQRDILRLPLVKLTLVRAIYLISAGLRNRLPWLYSKLRHKKLSI